MSAGLAALLDDIAVLARAAAASLDDVAAGAGRASVKAAGVIVDDAAVTPRYVHGFDPSRELPVVKQIAAGSLRNKLLIILPLALLLSELLPGLLTPLLMLGGAYLCFEGAEKVWEVVQARRGHGAAHGPAVAEGTSADEERQLVSGAIRTDLILSAEIMVIALGEVADQPLLSRALILGAVAVLITALVYGVVALIVKMDDAGLRLAGHPGHATARMGRSLVRAMPVVLSVLSTIGIAAMLWVGGHILLVGLDELGAGWAAHEVHELEHDARERGGALGGVCGWLTSTTLSAVLGLCVGAIVVAATHLRRGHGAAAH
ncbi:MAG: DUF808 domain-containing protein [Patulibacter sp.]